MPTTYPRWVVRNYFGNEQRSVQDFSLGSVQSVARDLVGVYEIRNGLVSQDAAVFKRGADAYYTTANGPDLAPVPFLWAGQLTPGTRMLAATPSHTFTTNYPSTTPITLSTLTPGKPARASEIGGMLFIDGGYLYAGSLKTANYTTGTIATTNGSATLTGTGTSWTANVDVGMLFNPTGGNKYYYVKSVDSNTSITLNANWGEAPLSGVGYTLSPFARESVTFSGTIGGEGSQVQSSIYAAVGGKLLVADGARVWESEPSDDNGVPQTANYLAGNYAELPDGSNVTGMIGLRGSALIFGTMGLYLLTNVALDIEDPSGNPQQSLQQLSSDLKLWGKEGLASWQNRIIAPCIDDVYLIDGVSAPSPLSRSLTPKFRSYVQAGYVPGLASVYANHYVLPILDPNNSYAVKDTLVCRLDRPVKTNWGTFFPWSFMDGSGANIKATTVLAPSGSAPLLLAGTGQSTGRVLNLSNWFSYPDFNSGIEHDGTVHNLDITLGDIPLGFSTSVVRFMRARYELAGDATSVLRAEIAQLAGSDANTAYDILSGDAPRNYFGQLETAEAWAWRVNKAGKFFRPRFVSSGLTTRMKLRDVQIDILPGRR